MSISNRKWLLRCAGAVLACFTAQLSACVLPSVSQQPEQSANAASTESTPATSASMDASTSAARDAASADSGSTKPAEPTAATDAGAATSEPAPSSAGAAAPSGGMSAMDTAGKSGSSATAGSKAGAPAAGQGGATAPPPMPGELGASCRTPSECDSGHCADGVCCATACKSECEKCNAAGKCELLDGEQDPGTCDDPRKACARGVCLMRNGSDCETDLDCASGNCLGRAQIAPTEPTPIGRCCAALAFCTACQTCSSDGESCAPTSGDACGQDGVCVNGQCSTQ